MALQALSFLISFLVTALLFTLIYKVLTDVTVKWKDVWIGGVVTALLFSLGRFLIGFYLGRGSVGSAYGAAGSLVIILLWIYYSSQILFFGAEFTKVFANTLGSHIKPSPHAEPVSQNSRLNQGMESKAGDSPAFAMESAKESAAEAGFPIRILRHVGRHGIAPFPQAEGGLASRRRPEKISRQDTLATAQIKHQIPKWAR